MTHSLKLEQFPEKLAIVQLGPGAEIPKWAESSSLLSITATARETTVICANRSVPRKSTHVAPYIAFAVEGPLDPAMTGVLLSLLGPMAAAEISVFSLSTFDTDWVLVPIADAERAAQEWRDAGHEVALAVPVTPHEPTREKSPDKRPDKGREKSK